MTDTLGAYRDSLAALDEAVERLGHELRGAAGAAEAAEANFAAAQKAAAAVRDAMAALAATAGEPPQQWQDRQGLEAEASRLAALAQQQTSRRWRGRLEEVAAALEAGRVVNRRTRRVVASLDQLRAAARADLLRAAGGDATVWLPGPPEGDWLAWAWGRQGTEFDDAVEPLRATVPALHQFLHDVVPDDWHPVTQEAPSPVKSADPVTVPPPQPVPPPSAPVEAPAKPITPPPVLRHPQPAPLTPRPLPIAPPPVPEPPAPQPADAEEIAALCAEGSFLRAALLSAGRAFAGLPEADPRFDALLAAHHVWEGARTPPWPEWCYDPEAAADLCEAAPESARLVLLASQCHSAGSDGGPALGDEMAQTLLAAFNDLPEVRRWLAKFLEVMALPGCLEQIRRPAAPDPSAEYGERRLAFHQRFEEGRHHRNDKAAYIHRLDNYLSRQPAFQKLDECLKQAKPEAVPAEARALIVAALARQASAFVDEWVASTDRGHAVVRLRGNQRSELVRRAEEYLGRANQAWKASESLARLAPAVGDVERWRKQLRELLGPALNQATGKLWSPLLERLTGGLRHE